MSIIKNVVDRHASIGLFRVDVPEWGAPGEPLGVFFNIIPSGAVDRAGRGLREDQQFEKYCRLMVALARTEDGEKAFDSGDIDQLLRKGEVRVITAVIEAALNFEAPENSPN
jgi:hypothetical protein